MRADSYLLGDQSSESPSTISAQKPSVKPGLATLLNQMFGNFAARMVGSEEPQIWQSDRAGSSVWHVYDPVTNQTSVFPSESEVRVWLDQRYNA
jgi:hypothetical protein